MSIDIGIVFIILISAITLFGRDKPPVDLTAMIIMTSLLLEGIITPKESIPGFSTPATVTVAAMFILSAGLFSTGALNFAGDFLTRMTRKNNRITLLFFDACFH